MVVPLEDEMADYLEEYAQHLPIHTGVGVERASREEGRYFVTCSDGIFEANHVVVASGTFQAPVVPEFASRLDPRIGNCTPVTTAIPLTPREGGPRRGREPFRS